MTQNWHVTFDPLHLVDAKDDFDKLEDEAREQGEDIIQAENGDGVVLDLGWYIDRYRVISIKDRNWTSPVEDRESKTLKQAVEDFRRLLK